MKEEYKPKKLLLKGIPEKAYRELLRVQGIEKNKTSKQVSLEKVIYKIIEDNSPEK